jgi:hypothetical protein
VTIAKNGTYDFEVRRWPKEVNCAINASPAAQNTGDIYSRNEPVLIPQGKTIRATKVKLRIGDAYFEKDISPDAEHVLFNIPLEKGDTEIQAWLVDPQENEHPAYYVYVNR